MEAKRHMEPSATTIAYQVVCQLGYRHCDLKRMFPGVTYPTLRLIRDGKNVKASTERHYLRILVSLINREYERRLHNGDDGATELLIRMKNILLAYL